MDAIHLPTALTMREPRGRLVFIHNNDLRAAAGAPGEVRSTGSRRGKPIATNATVAIVAASCYRRSMATAPTISRTDLQRVLPTFRKAAALIDVHPSFISRAVRDLGITPVEWGRRERYLQIPDVLLIATHARRNAVEEVAGGLVELAEQQAPELAGWVTTEAEQFLAALPALEPEDSNAFLAELRSELPGEWADRAEAIYRRHLND